jgi:hypothetical protein
MEPVAEAQTEQPSEQIAKSQELPKDSDPTPQYHGDKPVQLLCGCERGNFLFREPCRALSECDKLVKKHGSYCDTCLVRSSSHPAL